MIPTVQITYTGPGGGCTYDVELLKRSLEMLGYEVSGQDVTTPEALAKMGNMTTSEYMEQCRVRRSEYDAKYPLEPKLKAHIHVVNVPWGG